jgi:gliding motility-associated-like protein
MNQILYTIFSLLVGVVALAQPLAAAPLPGPSDGRTLEFVPNKGQWPSVVRYAGAVPSGHLYLEAGGLHYVLLEPIEHPHGTSASTAKAKSRHTLSSQPHAAPLPAADSLIHGHQLRVRFVGADVTTPLAPSEVTGNVRNYLHGSDPAKWAQAVPSYRQVRYQAPWPGIGARFYENNHQQLEYDFELEAGANPQTVKLKYEGATQLVLSSDGRLHVGTSVGELTELAPQAYQIDPSTGQHRPVACHYRLHAADSTVTFELGRYNHAQSLVIDPTVIFSTYSGAPGSNWGFTATYDAAGNMYSGGIVLDDSQAFPSYPTTPGAFRTKFGGLVDISISKYNTTVTGSASLVWATYLGGSSSEFPSSLVVNSQNELVILGTTASNDYPTSVTERSFKGGVVAEPFGSDSRAVYRINNGTDIVVTRLTSNGSGLSASTYLGGAGNDGLVAYQPRSSAQQLAQNYGDAFRGDILTDAQGNIYIASTTSSTDFPVTGGSFGTSYRGGTCDAVVVKLPPSLKAPIWSGYLGGSAADGAYSLQLDRSGNVYVTGGTLSQNFPNTAAGYMTSAQGNVDGFVARIAANGSSVQRATYLGTSSYDQAFFVQLGADGGVYLLGQTLGRWPVSPGVYSNADSRQFIQKLSPDLDRSLISTVFGSGRPTIDISPTAFLVDQCDRVYACGWGGLDINARASPNNGSTDGMPTTANAVRSTTDTPGAGADFYLAQFAPGLTDLSYGTYYGDATPFSEGDHVDGGTSRFDPRGVVYAAVCSCQNTAGFPVPLGAYTYSPVNGSITTRGVTGNLCNNAAFKLNFEPTIATVGADQTVCASGAPVALSGLPAGGVWSGPGVTGSVAGGFVFTPTPALAGVQTLTYTLAGVIPVCTATGQQRITVTPAGTAALAALPQATYCLQAGVAIEPIILITSPAGGTLSGPGVTGNQFSPAAAGPGLHTLTYTFNAGTPCVSTATRVVRVVGAAAGPALSICAGSTAIALSSGQPAGGTWSGIGVSGSVATGFVFTPTAALSGSTQTLTYTVPAPDGSCAAIATQTISVTPLPQVTAPAQPAVCATPTAMALTGGQPVGGVWSGPGVSTSGTGSYVFTPSQALVGTQTLTYTVTSAQGCSSQASTTIQVLPALVITMPADTVLCPGSNQPMQLKALPAGGTWSGPGITASGVFTPPTGPGISALVYTVGSGTPCPVVATRRITLLAAPALVPAVQPLLCPSNGSSTATAPAVAPYTVQFSQPVATLLADAVLTWDFGDGSAPATGLSVTHTYTTAGSFQPKATLHFNSSRCSTSLTLAPIEVQSMLIPNVFTPNGDKQNDYFAPRLGGCQPRLQVFSRWGQKLYDSPAYFNNWDGAGQAAGLYYYLITPPDGGAPIKGWVELIR